MMAPQMMAPQMMAPQMAQPMMGATYSAPTTYAAPVATGSITAPVQGSISAPMTTAAPMTSYAAPMTSYAAPTSTYAAPMMGSMGGFGMGMGMPSYTPPMTTAPMSYAQPMPT